MKRRRFCDIVNVDKEKQRQNSTTLRDSVRYLFAGRLKCSHFSAVHSIMQKI